MGFFIHFFRSNGVAGVWRVKVVVVVTVIGGAPKLFAKVLVKCVSLPFDSGRKIFHAGIHCTGQI